MRANFYLYYAIVLCLAVVVAGAPLPELKSFDLGNAGAAVTAEVTDGGTCVVNGSGSVAYNGRDEARFTGLETEEPAFTFIARVAKVGGLTATSKYGLAVRASQWGGDKVVNWGYDARDGRRCLQWFARYSSRLKDDEGGQRCFTDGIVEQMKDQQGFWLKVTRRYPYVEMAFSMDGTKWTPVQYRAALLAKKVLVGMQVTAGGDGKQPVVISYDNVSYSVDKMPEEAQQDSLHEYTQPLPAWKMSLAKVEGAKGQFSAYMLLPPDMNPTKIRAILFTPGDKELLLAGNVSMKFDALGLLRKPVGVAEYEGVFDIAGMRPFYQGLASEGIVRVGGVFGSQDYAKAIERLAVVSGIAWLPNVPVISMGESTAIGANSCIADIVGPGADSKRLHLQPFNTHDGNGLSAMLANVPKNNAKHALWACAPMWTVGHKPSQSEALTFPFILEAMRMRIPENCDYSKGAPVLNTINEEDGWAGAVDSWTSNMPKVAPWKDAGIGENRVWLLNESVANTWQATVANFPRVVINFPTYDGNASFDNALPAYWHDSTLEANVPFEIVASGPIGTGLKVSYYEGNRLLKVATVLDGPYHVMLDGLAPGIHSIHMVVEVDGGREISHPVLVAAVEKK